MTHRINGPSLALLLAVGSATALWRSARRRRLEREAESIESMMSPDGAMFTSKTAPRDLKNILLKEKLATGHTRIVSASDTRTLQPGDPGWMPEPDKDS